jgi:hypothetical protein
MNTKKIYDYKNVNGLFEDIDGVFDHIIDNEDILVSVICDGKVAAKLLALSMANDYEIRRVVLDMDCDSAFLVDFLGMADGTKLIDVDYFDDCNDGVFDGCVDVLFIQDALYDTETCEDFITCSHCEDRNECDGAITPTYFSIGGVNQKKIISSEKHYDNKEKGIMAHIYITSNVYDFVQLVNDLFDEYFE